MTASPESSLAGGDGVASARVRPEPTVAELIRVVATAIMKAALGPDTEDDWQNWEAEAKAAMETAALSRLRQDDEIQGLKATIRDNRTWAWEISIKFKQSEDERQEAWKTCFEAQEIAEGWKDRAKTAGEALERAIASLQETLVIAEAYGPEGRSPPDELEAFFRAREVLGLPQKWVLMRERGSKS